MRFDVQEMLRDIQRCKSQDWLDHYDEGLSEDYGAIPLVSLDGRLDGADAQRPLPLSEYHRYQPTRFANELPYFRKIMDAVQCPKGRTRIMKLAPGAKIASHRDIAEEVACFEFDHVRLHIPIQTNDKVFFYVGDERLHMAPGRLYYVNFIKKHWVHNGGDNMRTHLVMDLRVNDWLRSIFPPHSTLEKVEAKVVTSVLPAHWALMKFKTRSIRRFWNAYEGSTVQSAYHRLRGKKSTSVT
jgi:hypothetical protein